MGSEVEGDSIGLLVLQGRQNAFPASHGLYGWQGRRDVKQGVRNASPRTERRTLCAGVLSAPGGERCARDVQCSCRLD